MKLYIKELLIQINGKEREHYRFKPKVDAIFSKEAYDVITFLLGVQEPKKTLEPMEFFAVVELEQTYHIRGKKEGGDLLFTASVLKEGKEECGEEYFELVRQSPESETALFFHPFKRQDFPHRLLKYKELLKNHPEGDFAACTNGYGTTRSFRGFMAQYIRYFKPIRLREGKDLYLHLSKEGVFRVECAEGKERGTLSESETMLYHYLSFISLADFWARAEKIRNLHRAIKPLVVSNFLEFLDESVPLSEVMERSEKVGRQVLFCLEKRGNESNLSQ